MVKIDVKRLVATDKAEVKKLIAGGLSGWEAGLLVFRDSWEVDHDRPGLLTKRDIDRLRNGLRSSKDTEAYNALISLYRVVDFIRRQRQYVFLQSIMPIWSVISLVGVMAALAKDLFIEDVFAEIADAGSPEELAAITARYEKQKLRQLLLTEVKQGEPLGETAARLVSDCNKAARSILSGLREVAAATQVLREVGEVVGFDLMALEDSGGCDQEGVAYSLVDEDVLLQYQATRQIVPDLGPAFKGLRLPAIPPLHKVKPHAATADKYRSWIAEKIGEDWWIQSLEGPGEEEEAKDG